MDDGSGFSLSKIQFFSFGKTGRDVNMCDVGSANYHWDDKSKILLNGTTATGRLVSDLKQVYPPLTVNMSILKSSALNVHWAYEDAAGKRPLFEVPLDIVNTTRESLAE